jgi:SAM-dependent methyltransferase
VYDVYDYTRMTEDATRVSAYLAALSSVVTADSVVLDLGTGVGLFAIAAAKLGARHVYGVDINSAVLLGPELAKAAGVADRVTFLHGSAWELSLPQKADVLFYDLRGASPLFTDNFRLVARVKEEWLAPGGVHFPRKDRIVAALVRAPKVRAKIDAACAAAERMGAPSAPLRASLVHTPLDDAQAPLGEEDVLSEPFEVAALAYGEAPPRGISRTAKSKIVRADVADAVGVWFATELVDGVAYTSGPGQSQAYPRMILPLATPLQVGAGDEVTVALSALTDGGDWAWSVSLERADGSSFQGPRQSSFLGRTASMQSLLAGSSASKPTLNAAGQDALRALAAFDGKATLDELARRFARGPGAGAIEEALRTLRTLAERYGR